jgi:hypothetical protein
MGHLLSIRSRPQASKRPTVVQGTTFADITKMVSQKWYILCTSYIRSNKITLTFSPTLLPCKNSHRFIYVRDLPGHKVTQKSSRSSKTGWIVGWLPPRWMIHIIIIKRPLHGRGPRKVEWSARCPWQAAMGSTGRLPKGTNKSL